MTVLVVDVGSRGLRLGLRILTTYLVSKEESKSD